jgi:hypothetical protein
MNDEALDRVINALQQAVRDRVADTKEIELRLNLLKKERQRRQTEGRWGEKLSDVGNAP